MVSTCLHISGRGTPMVGERLAGQPRPEMLHRWFRQQKHRMKLFILSETTFRKSPNNPWISHEYPMNIPWIPHEYPMNIPWIEYHLIKSLRIQGTPIVFLMVNDGAHGYFQRWASGGTLALATLATLATLTKPGAKTIGDQSISVPCYSHWCGTSQQTNIYIFYIYKI